MPYDSWPVGVSGDTFPQEAFLGVKQTFESATVSFRTSWGPAKVRRAGTRDREFHSTPMELTGSQLAVFNEWFDSALMSGVNKFVWRNMVTGESNAVYRFQVDDQGRVKRPSWELVSPAPNFQDVPGEGGVTQRHYIGVIELELMPE